MATFLPAKSLSPFLHSNSNQKTLFHPPPIIITKLSFLSPSEKSIYRSAVFIPQAKKKKNPWLDAFDDGEDSDMEYGSLYVDGKQEEDPTLPDNPNNPYGFLKFPPGYAVEVASLGSKVRGDVRRCCCIISGGVYENLLFFPAIQLMKDRYPGVQIDVVTTERGKQTYELNKNIRWTTVYDPDDHFPEPAEYTDMIGVLRVSSNGRVDRKTWPQCTIPSRPSTQRIGLKEAQRSCGGEVQGCRCSKGKVHRNSWHKV